MNHNEGGWTVITGSTGGIGSEIAERCASQGRSLVLVNRSSAKAEAQRSEILARHPGLEIELVSADLLDLDQIVRATARIEALPGRVDALYNNAGILTAEKVLSRQGLESQFAVNTLAPYLFVRALKAKMARPLDEVPGMVVNFSSGVVQRLKVLELDQLAHPAHVGGLMGAYAQSKLAVTAMAPALAPELGANNILIRAVDPGATKTAMTTGGSSGMPRLLAWVAPLLFQPAGKQAAKLVASSDPEAHGGRTGIFVANQRERRMPAPAADEGVQRALIALLDGLLPGD